MTSTIYRVQGQSFFPQTSHPGGARLATMAQGIAGFFGLFAILNLVGGIWIEGFDVNLWWIDLRWFPAWFAQFILGASGGVLLLYGMGAARSRFLRLATIIPTALFLGVSLLNTAVYYRLWLRGAIQPASPVPFSAFVAGAMALILCAIRVARFRPVSPWGRLAVVCGCGVLFPLALMVLFGKTDYRRPAQAAVVMGARVYADGRLSDALADRVRTACELYREGWVPLLIMSGGPGDGVLSESEAMKRAALEQGVPASAILLDSGGVNTEATVENTLRTVKERRLSKLLVVSHGYHLPRVRLAYQRSGVDVATVPARESYFLRQMPFNMAREVAAIWVYFSRPAWR